MRSRECASTSTWQEMETAKPAAEERAAAATKAILAKWARRAEARDRAKDLEWEEAARAAWLVAVAAEDQEAREPRAPCAPLKAPTMSAPKPPRPQPRLHDVLRM